MNKSGSRMVDEIAKDIRTMLEARVAAVKVKFKIFLMKII